MAPIWAALESIPIEAIAPAPDLLWDRLAQLWPQLSLTTRRGLVAAAAAWANRE